MTVTDSTPDTTRVSTPQCCGQDMQPKEAFVTQRLFYRCGKCLRNNYSQGASTHAHTVR